MARLWHGCGTAVARLLHVVVTSLFRAWKKMPPEMTPKRMYDDCHIRVDGWGVVLWLTSRGVQPLAAGETVC